LKNLGSQGRKIQMHNIFGVKIRHKNELSDLGLVPMLIGHWVPWSI